jgi:uncharacterized protein HemX
VDDVTPTERDEASMTLEELQEKRARERAQRNDARNASTSLHVSAACQQMILDQRVRMAAEHLQQCDHRVRGRNGRVFGFG